ncbi:imidazole glycerol phosphate synthase subunit HisH [uncultured Pseudodesulfovibrio sp.]|uniref:imidazole glycerol phosphate synthase subunit HisH n=1 Tax=uncultured Pseudodesulfovibrio sp. TaxID=2035858 RepID=UPI0029C6B2D6|nr:imidazole glycerol phosphate synthase subunit HisH [uncultured Pseudodesulfovibrio sp.]
MNSTDVAIIDYGLGNLFSIKHACEHVGLTVSITNEIDQILSAKSVILPGVGAFGDAMKALRRLDLISPIKDVFSKGTPLLGICLGLQLLFTESEEFGHHKGLDLIPGTVKYFSVQQEGDRTLKVPQVGWNSINLPPEAHSDHWESSLLHKVPTGTDMHFVHSCYVVPENADNILSVTRYGEIEFCSGSQHKNITAFQFHPERSGKMGLQVYTNFAQKIHSSEEQ